MNGVNLAFVEDEDEQVKKEESNLSKQVAPSVIDYSKAKSLPQVFAALVGNWIWQFSTWWNSGYKFFKLAAYSSLLLGTAFGWSSAVQSELRGLTVNNQTDKNSAWYIILNDDEMSWVGSLLNIGALLGAVCGALLMDKYGRRFTLILMSIPYITGSLMITLAINTCE